MREQSQVEDSAASPTIVMSRARPVIGAAAIGVFILDTITPEDSAVAVLYVGVVLLLCARSLHKRGVVIASLGLMALTVVPVVN
jgi:hypothetical protein